MSTSNYVPKTLDEAVDYLIKSAGSNQQESVKKMTEDEFMGNTHHFLGRQIRNDWGFWESKGELANYFISLDIKHPDDMSGIILKKVYNKINNIPFNIDEEVNYYKAYWQEQK